jgi:phosphoglycolate phosphatase
MISVERVLCVPLMPEKIKLIVFDWDGTLMDSEAQIVACLHAAIADLGLDPMDDLTVKNVIGLGLHEAIDMLVPGRDDSFQQAFVEHYRKHWFQSGASLLFEGVREVLDTLQKQQLLLGIATGKARRGLERVLDETKLAAFFHSTRCADEAPSKPHPQMLLEIMAELEVLPKETLMVGDTEYDMEMASNAGAARVGVRTGVHSEERLHRHAPLVCLGRLSELPAWLADAGLIEIRQ